MSKDRTFKTGEVAALFGVAPETIRSWTDKFSEFLSEDATASSGSHRVYHYDYDIRVLAFVDEMRAKYSHDEIIVSLKAIALDSLPEPTEPLSANLSFNEIGMKVDELQSKYMATVEELEDAKLELARMEERLKRADEAEVIREASLKEANARIESLIKLNTKLRVLLAIEKGEDIDLGE